MGAGNKIGPKTADKLRLAAARGGWRAAGFTVGKPGCRVPAILKAGLMTYDWTKRDYVITDEGRRFIAGHAADDGQAVTHRVS